MNLKSVNADNNVVTAVPGFKNENGMEAPLIIGDNLEIEPMVKHWTSTVRRIIFTD